MQSRQKSDKQKDPASAATPTGEGVDNMNNIVPINSTIECWARKDRRSFGWGMFALGVFLGVVITIMVVLFTSPAYAEDELTYPCWVICQPDDYVNIRAGANRHAEVTGWAVSGMQFRTDWREKNGFIHLVGVTEYGDGWISEGYVVFTDPQVVNRDMVITGGGRVAARKTIECARRKWLKPGETVTVYRISDEWAVTSAGFVQSRFLGE